MIPPLVLTIRVARGRKRVINLWLPLLVVWPLAVLGILVGAPLAIAAAAIQPGRARTWLQLGPRAFGVLCSTRGLSVAVKDQTDEVDLRFR